MECRNNILLSICIPTYNRAKFLDLCLCQICKQINSFTNKIEVIVSDNASNDDTLDTVNRYRESGYMIKYIINNENIGADKNFEQCFRIAKGKYVWIFGDDDVLLDNALQGIVNLLEKANYGNIYINNYWFNDDFRSNISSVPISLDYKEYNDYEKYIKRVHYWITFATGNIFNKSLLPIDFDSNKYISTNLSQVNWYLNALLEADSNVVINTQLLACKGGNTGGYELFKTFGENLRKICFDVAENRKVSKDFVRAIDNQLICSFLPQFVINSKKINKSSFLQENPKLILHTQFKGNIYYWLFIWPLFFLPLRIDSLYLRIIKRICLK